MDFVTTFWVILNLFIVLLIVYLIFQQQKSSKKIDSITDQNSKFLESIEKYVEIFNEQNVNELIEKNELIDESLANKKINTIRNEYRNKLKDKNENLNEEHEMLIDFVTLTLSLLIKTPPSLRYKLIDDNTDNEVIKKILISKLPSIEKHYIPVSLIEVAIAKDNI